MKKEVIKLLALILTLSMCLGLVTAFADETESADIQAESAQPETEAAVVIPAETEAQPETEATQEVQPKPETPPEVQPETASAVQTEPETTPAVQSETEAVLEVQAEPETEAAKAPDPVPEAEEDAELEVQAIADGFYKVGSRWYWVQDQNWQSSMTGIVYGTINGKTAWYYIRNGVFRTATGITQAADGSDSKWYYVKNGVFTRATGIVKAAAGNDSNWYYIRNGVFKNATGITKKADGSSNVWYYVKNGVYKKTTTLARRADGADDIWYYVNSGKFTKYTGTVKIGSGYYILEDGKLQLEKTWKAVYLKVLQKYKTEIQDSERVKVSNDSVAFFDLTGDGIPEMFFDVLYSSNDRECYIVSYNNGRAKQIQIDNDGYVMDSIQITFMIGRDSIFTVNGSNKIYLHNVTAHRWWNEGIFELEYSDGKLKEKTLLYAGMMDPMNDDMTLANIVSWEINGVTVSESRFKNEFKKYTDNVNQVLMGDMDTMHFEENKDFSSKFAAMTYSAAVAYLKK